MREECTCGGSNENCYRCFGLGYYDTIEVKSPQDITKKQKFNYNKKNKKINNSKNNANANIKNTNKKIVTINSMLMQPKPIDNNINKEKISKTECPHCRLLVNIEKFDYHINKYHGGIKIEAKNNSDKTMLRCPHCDCMVRSDRFKRHIKKIHMADHKKELAPSKQKTKNHF
jgi:uncharacterized C2H2 Zn-finger protein